LDLDFDINTLTADSILSDDLLSEVFNEDDAVYQTRAIMALEDRASQLGVKTKFSKLVSAYKAAKREYIKANRQKSESLGNYTNFGSDKYPDVYCGNWVADESGVRTYDNTGVKLACYHPILPIEVLTNVETNVQKVTLAFCRKGRWSKVTVPKSVVSNNNKIVALADLGISVTSDNAKYLVRYLADVENEGLVRGTIPERLSTAKMGWIDGKFMPYDCEYEFDAESQFRESFKAIGKKGKRDKWFSFMLEMRQKRRPELRFMMSAAFASTIVKLCNALPFWASLWGESGGGKTVCLMCAASIFADPCNYRYIADCRQTDVSMELRASFFNNLPLMLDDTATVKEKYGDDFSKVIYSLASGKGKGRATRDLGLRNEETWCNTILITGERALSTENLQGGAINRVLDFEMQSGSIFDDGQSAVNLLRSNYGFAGEEFIEAIHEIGIDGIREMQKEILSYIQNRDEDKLEKQSISLSILLTADKIATDYLFNDGIYLTYDEVKQVLVDRSDMSENERCYEYILGEIAINAAKFTTNSFGDRPIEQYGEFETMDDGSKYAVIYANVFNSMCKKGGYSSKSFLSWAAKNGRIVCQNDRYTKVKRINDTTVRCVNLLIQEAETIKDDSEELPY
jgi:hypothetical protein